MRRSQRLCPAPAAPGRPRSTRRRARWLALLPTLLATVAVGQAAAAAPRVVRHRLTATADLETEPALGNDGLGDYVVYTRRPVLPGGNLGPGEIVLQRLTDEGAPDGAPNVISEPATDDRLVDASGDHIVYTSYDSTGGGSIVLYTLSTGASEVLGGPEDLFEAKIEGSHVVWRRRIGGSGGTIELVHFDLAWRGTGRLPEVIAAGGVFFLEVGDRYVVWAVWTECPGGASGCDFDLFAYELATGSTTRLTATPGVNELKPATDGPWVAWQAQVVGAVGTSIELLNMDTGARRTVAANAVHVSPRLAGGRISWEGSFLSDDYDVFSQDLATGESVMVSGSVDNQYLHHPMGDKVAYVTAGPREGPNAVGQSDIVVAWLAPPSCDASARDSVLVYALDASGSMIYGGTSCRVDAQVQAVYPNGRTLLACAIGVAASLNAQAAQDPRVGEVGAVLFADRARALDLAADPGEQPLVAPGSSGGSPLVANDVEAALRSVSQRPDYWTGGDETVQANATVFTAFHTARFGSLPESLGRGSELTSGLGIAIQLALASAEPRKRVLLVTDGSGGSGASDQLLRSLAAAGLPVPVVDIYDLAGQCQNPSAAIFSLGRCFDIGPVESAALPGFAGISDGLGVERSLWNGIGGEALAADVNGDGVAVGWGEDTGGTRHALLWRDDASAPVLLGALAGHTSSDAFGVDVLGRVAGNSEASSLDRQAFLVEPLDTDGDLRADLWYRDANADGVNDLMTPIPTLGGPFNRAYGMNGRGQVVGDSELNPAPPFGSVHAFLFTPGAGSVDLGTLGGNQSSATHVSDDGSVWGASRTAAGDTVTFRLTPLDTSGDGQPDTWYQDADADGANDLMEPVALELPPDVLTVRIESVNDFGEVVGNVFALLPGGGSSTSAAYWAPNGHLTSIGLGGEGSVAYDLNARGVLVGGAVTPAGETHPFLAQGGACPVDLGALSGSTGTALALNEETSSVVGYSADASGVGQPARWSLENTFAGDTSQVIDREAGLVIRLDDVQSAGMTTVTASTENPGPEPGLFQLDGIFYDVDTTAVVQSAQICIPYAGTQTPRILHLVNGSWTPLYTRWMRERGLACARTPSLSWFALAFDPEAPVAVAGPEQDVPCTDPDGTPVQLDGSGSYDPQGDPLGYAWSTPTATAVGARPTLAFPLGTTPVTLVVSDGASDSDPDTTEVRVHAQVTGLEAPFAALVPEEQLPPLPAKAFKAGRTLPLELVLGCGEGELTDAHVAPPVIASLNRSGDAVDLEVVDLDAGQSNEGSVNFRYEAGSWRYNLSTRGLGTGTWVVTLEMPDGSRWDAAFVLR